MKKILDIVNSAYPQLKKMTLAQSQLEQIKQALEKTKLFQDHQEHYTVLKFSEKILYIGTTTAAFATQCRHHSPSLIKELQQHLKDIPLKSIHCKISSFSKRLNSKKTVEKQRTQKVLDKKTEEHLEKLIKASR